MLKIPRQAARLSVWLSVSCCLLGSIGHAYSSDAPIEDTSAIAITTRSSADEKTCRALQKVFDANKHVLQSREIETIATFYKWKIVARLDEGTKQLHLENDSIQEAWFDIDNDGTIDHVYRTRQYRRGVRGDVLHVLSRAHEDAARKRGVSLLDLVSYSENELTIDLHERASTYDVTDFRDDHDKERWSINPNVLLYPFLWRGEVLVLAHNNFRNDKIATELYVFKITRQAEGKRIQNRCLFQEKSSY